jgi:bifunctional ADP-heptose synthase (sugar kinase/adenylyltransferase)
MKRVMVLGDICTDVYWQGSISGISAEAPVPVVKCDSVFTLSGMAANVAHLLQTLGGIQVILPSRPVHTGPLRIDL